MTGLNIFYVSPRLVGPADGWSGRNNSNGRSWLVDHAHEMSFNAIWFSPFFKTTDVTVQREGRTLSGSIYAIKDHFAIDSDFAARNGADDDHIRHFTAQAAAKNMVVMGDMVFNHVARDHPLVLAEEKQLQNILQNATNISPIWANGTVAGMSYDTPNQKGRVFYFKFERNPDLTLTLPGTDHETWEDVAQINYNSPAAVEFFVSGKEENKGYWKQVLDWHIDRGFTGFRCDVAYKVPPQIWSELIQYAHDRLPDVVFMAETLGDNGQANRLKDAVIDVNGKKQKAFDLAMLGTYWWNMKDDWMIHENRRMQAISRFGGAAFPDNHDTPNTVASHFLSQFANAADPARRDRAVSDICLREYAVAALISNSVYMQLGYEYCRKPISVFRDPAAPLYWKQLQAERGDINHPLNLTRRIKAINDFRAQLDNSKAVVDLQNIETLKNNLIEIKCVLRHHQTGQKLGRMLIYINDKPEAGPVRIMSSDLVDPQTSQRLNRLVLGPGDTQNAHFNVINDVAAFYTPLTNQNHQRPSPGSSPDFRAA